MVRVAIALMMMLLIVCLPSIAWAQGEKRIALLIGNQSYGSEIGRLANPHNDVALLERALRGLGFDVATVRDAGLATLHQAVNGYARRLQAAGPNAVGFFYYSGHGAADAGTNYLIPVDVKTTETGELWDQSLRLTAITRQLKSEAGNATHFVVFDACRNTLKLTRAGSRTVVQSKGFVPVSQESGMLIAYATAEGELASDIGQGAGPYAKVLAEEIVKPGVEAVYMFRRVQVRVRSTIGQEPWLGFSALGEVHLAGLESPKPVPDASSLIKPLTRAEERALRPRDSFRECIDCPEMVVASAGEFAFGSAQHKVVLAKTFAVGKFSVTFGEWNACAQERICGDQFVGHFDPRRPVVLVSWEQVTTEYLGWLSNKTGKKYRLLSEAEWEYAARAGGPPTSVADDHAAAARANAFGIYGMGAVPEWVADCYYSGHPPSDGGMAPEVLGCRRVLRGAFRNVLSRHENCSDCKNEDLGFRVARTLD
jgi:formylglycine-generating enzyme required for sulfatase activity